MYWPSKSLSMGAKGVQAISFRRRDDQKRYPFLYRLLRSLEDESRCVVDIRASKSDRHTLNELVFDVHCTTIDELFGLHEQLSNGDTELPQLLLNILDTLADFKNVTLKVEKHEDFEPIPDIDDFKINIRKKSPGSKVSQKNFGVKS